jgi:hypothetical protein
MTWQDRGVNPSQEPAQPQQPGRPPVDPTADPAAYAPPAAPPAPDPFGPPSHGPGVPAPHGSESGPVPYGSGSGPAPYGSGSGSAPYGGGTEPQPGWQPVGPGYELAHPSGPPGGPSGLGRFARPFAFQQAVRRPWRRTVIATVSCAAAVLLLGVPFGLLWRWIAPSVPVIDAGQNGIVVNDPSPEEYIAADGWFTLIGLGFGLLVAIAAWLIMRRDRGPFLMLGVVTGALGAGWLVAPWVGEMIGRADYQAWQETAAQGATYLAPPQVHSLGPSLVPAFIAAIVLTLLAGWSNDPDLDESGAQPGYGPNHPESEPPDHPYPYAYAPPSEEERR